MTYAGAILGAALVIAVKAVTYFYCLISSGFDLVQTDRSFAVSTSHFGTMVGAAKTGAICPGLLAGVWISWHAILKKVNPFYYLWKRTGK